jgi:hypothetical protein
VFCRTALITPNGTPRITEKNNAKSVSLALIGMRGAISSMAGRSET